MNPQVRRSLTREDVLSMAVGLADTHGLDKVTMRRLGEALGVEAMSLYHHVANKDDLIGGMLERVVSQFALPDAADPWRVALRKSAVSAHRALLDHPWACELLMSRNTSPTPARLAFMDAVLATLERGGLSPTVVYHALHAFENHLFGYTLQEASFPYDATELQELAATFLGDEAIADLPAMKEHVRAHLDPDITAGSGFEFTLDLILDGLDTAAPIDPDF